MRLAALLLGTALLLAACGGADDEAAPRDPPSAGAPGPGGGLTIAEALATEAEGPLLIRGSLLVEGGEARLCSALLESHPPQCGRPSLRVENLPRSELDALERAGDVAWSDRPVSLLGDVAGEVLTIRPTAIPSAATPAPGRGPIAFWRKCGTGCGDVYVVTESRPGLRRPTEIRRTFAPTWSPDGGSIAFASDVGRAADTPEL